VFYIVSALGISAAIHPALADAEAEAKAKDDNDPSVKECLMSNVTAHTSVLLGGDVDKAKSEKAIADCAKVITDLGHSSYWRAAAFRYIGESQTDLGDYQRSLVSLNKSLELNSSDETTYSDRGDVYKKLRLTNKAVSDYERAASLSVGNLSRTVLFQKLAILYNDDGQYDLAIAYMTKAIEIAPDIVNKSNLYKNRGTMWSNKGDSERAQADFKKSIDLKSK